jgi:hypothetical protein
VVVLRLGDQDQDRFEPEVAAVKRGRQAVIGADRPAGDNRRAAAAQRVAEQPLELSRLVAGVAAIDAVVLDPDGRRARFRGAGEGADRGRGDAQRKPFEVEIEVANRAGDGDLFSAPERPSVA